MFTCVVFGSIVAFSIISESLALTEAERQVVLSSHNGYRSTLAKGQAQNPDGTFLPPGSSIYGLTINPQIEAMAQNYANGCVYKHSTSAQRNGTGENLYMISSALFNNTYVLQNAADLWWKELAQHGFYTQDQVFTQADFDATIGHWSQMAWEKTREIGCGVSHCPDQSMTMVVCNYSPAGNYLNQRVYISGPPCTQSTGCVNTPTSTCDTSSNLCFVGGVPSTIVPGTTAQPATIPTVVSTVVTSHSAAPSEQPTTVARATGESSAPPSTAASQATTAGPEQSSPAPGASSSATESSTGASQAPTSASEAPTGASAGSSPAASEAPTGASAGSSPAASEQPTAASVQPTGASGGPTSASEAPTGASAGSSPAASEAPTGASAGSSPAASEAPTGASAGSSPAASEQPTAASVQPTGASGGPTSASEAPTGASAGSSPAASEAPTGASAGSSPAASVQPTPASEQPTGASGGPTSASEAPTAGSSPGTPPPQSESPGPSGEPTGQTVPSITGSPGTTPSGACHDPEVNPNLPQGSCSDLPDLIRVKPDNTTDLTNTIQNWHRCQNVSTRLGANSMLNRVRRAIWNDSMYPTIESKIKEISSALQGYNFNNPTKQQILFNLTIVAWNRSIGGIIDCAEQM